MYTVSDAFLAAIAGTHTSTFRLDIYSWQTLIASSRPGSGIDLTVTGGRVDVDWQADVTRNFTATLLDTDGTLLAAMQPGQILSPMSRPAVFPYRGVRYADGTEELVPIGVFFLEEFTPSHDAGLTITISGRDLSGYIADNVWNAPYFIASTSTVHDAVVSIVVDRLAPYQSIGPDWASSKLVGGDLTFTESANPWREAQQIAASDGFEVFCDQRGQTYGRVIPDPDVTTPVYTFGPGAGRLLRGSSTQGDLKGLYNGVIVRGNAPWLRFPVSGEAWDGNPLSPTYYLGSFGRRPKIIELATVGSDAECDAAAAAQLGKVLGYDESGSFTGLVNPALEAGDVVQVTETGLGLSQVVCALDTFTIPFDGKTPMRFTTRRRRRVS